MSDDLERMARPICETLFGPFETTELDAEHSTSSQAILAALAALAAIREPSEAMLQKAMAPYTHEIDDKMRAAFRETIVGYWRAMIDAILAPEQPK